LSKATLLLWTENYCSQSRSRKKSAQPGASGIVNSKREPEHKSVAVPSTVYWNFNKPMSHVICRRIHLLLSNWKRNKTFRIPY